MACLLATPLPSGSCCKGPWLRGQTTTASRSWISPVELEVFDAAFMSQIYGTLRDWKALIEDKYHPLRGVAGVGYPQKWRSFEENRHFLVTFGLEATEFGPQSDEDSRTL